MAKRIEVTFICDICKREKPLVDNEDSGDYSGDVDGLPVGWACVWGAERRLDPGKQFEATLCPVCANQLISHAPSFLVHPDLKWRFSGESRINSLKSEF